MNLKVQIKNIRELSKSGIVTLVLISVFAGYLIGQSAEVPFLWDRMLRTLLGILFLSSSSSALNQLQEVEFDRQMPRTAGRPLPSGRMSVQTVQVFIAVTLVLGLLILYTLDLKLLWMGLAAVLFYNGLYTLWWKRHWAYAAVPGAIPGALPILMGYTAATGRVFSPQGLYLFFILFYWQMPHFWALALRFKDDYAQGGFPTLPVKHGQGLTLRQITVWCISYSALVLIAPFFIHVRWVYWVPSLGVTVKVLYELYLFVSKPEGKQWLHFFLWVNFSLVFYLGAAIVDLWSYFLPIPHFTR
jgi:protoheme IX farnesyltransferase